MPLRAQPITNTNRYALLVDDNEPAVAQRSPAKRVPPIVVFETSYQEIVTTLNQINLPQSEYKLKFLSVGIRIQTKTIDSHKNALEALKTLRPCYSFGIESEKLVKFVLTGLPEFNIEYLKEGLTAEGIPFTDVKQMTLIKRSIHRAKYLVYFEPNTITLTQLREIPHIHNVTVHWEKYAGARIRPTQCNNCQLYGHGAKNCYSPPRCCKCGGEHTTAACIKDKNPAVPLQPRCCLCAGAHMSNDFSCEKRQFYIQRREQTAKGNSRRTVTPRSDANGADSAAEPAIFQQYPQDFPPIRPVYRSVPAKVQVHSLPSMIQRVPGTSQPPPTIYLQNDRPSTSPYHQPQLGVPAVQNNSLFTKSELFAITTELIVALRCSESQQDQFDAVATVAMKFGMSTPECMQQQEFGTLNTLC